METAGKEESILDEAKSAMLGRFRDPLVLGYAIGFLACNWRFLYVLAFRDGSTTQSIKTATAFLTGWSYFLPAVIGATWAFGLPFLSALGFKVRDIAALQWERWRDERRAQAEADMATVRKKINAGVAMTPEEWRDTLEFKDLERERHLARQRWVACERTLCEAWKRMWPKEIAGTERALVAVLEGAIGAGQFGVRSANSMGPAGASDIAGVGRNRLVFVFDFLSGTNLGVAVEPGGLTPWLHGNSDVVLLMRDGSVQPHPGEQKIGADVVALIRRCPEPHAQWGQFELA